MQIEETTSGCPETVKSRGDAAAPPRAVEWLSRGFEALIGDLDPKGEREPCTRLDPDFDVVVVGSGYGGAVAASELARLRGDKVCVLERGRERLPGSFPARFADLAGDVRFSHADSTHSRGETEGLFDVRVGPDVSVIVANGVGGGSLINAGVMELPEAGVFDEARWPTALHGKYKDIVELAVELRQSLDVRFMDDGCKPLPNKMAVMETVAPDGTFRQVPITVALTRESGFTTQAGVRVAGCIRCGDCATGCNHNAKLSLDATLLARARRAGAMIFAGATVLRIERVHGPSGEALWMLEVVHTATELRQRQATPLRLIARKVVLAAGTLGSTEILKRSESTALPLSKALGRHFSTNGDMMAVSYDMACDVGAVNDESLPRPGTGAPDCGPTITTMIDLRATGGGVIQDMSVPGPLRWVMQETVTTSAAIDRLKESDATTYAGNARDGVDPCAVDPAAISRSLMVAMLGRDSASGTLRLNASAPSRWYDGDGGITVDWKDVGAEPGFAARQAALAQHFGAAALGGRVLANPLWKMLPDELDFLFEGRTGSLVTVHPLGGCAMGDDATDAVVDDCGRVFDPSRPGEHHDGLVVLDGAIIPTSLGINPSLTISAIALRAVRTLCDAWTFDGTAGHAAPIDGLDVRPVFKTPDMPFKAKPTQVEVMERLNGPLEIAGIGLGALDASASRPRWVELTMRFDPVTVASLVSPSPGAATLTLPASQGRLRIFDEKPRSDEDATDDKALLIAEVSGTLRAFQHEPSGPIARGLRGLWAWFRNRGLRDTVLAAIDGLQSWRSGKRGATTGGLLQSIWQRAIGAIRLATRAGDRRLMTYDLRARIVHTRPDVAVDMKALGDAGALAIRGHKTLTYSRRANPWTQLMTLHVDAFPGLASSSPATLTLDQGFLARAGLPLLRIVDQQDQPGALSEMGSLMLYLARMMVHVHAWSFRAPDKPVPRELERLPGRIAGIPDFESTLHPVGETPDGRTVNVRLTHYRGRNFDATWREEANAPLPVVLFHGYSVSGNTFTHPALDPCMAKFLWDAGRDVWVVDLRTSSGMEFPTLPWTFEDVARADIPLAIAQVLAATRAPKVDAFAHCMGSAMLSMALLKDDPDKQYWKRDEPLSAFVNSLGISQVPPAVIMTPANVFRAFMIRTLKNYLPITDYQFRQKADPSYLDQVIDRLLATVPYPVEEFDYENPFWTPWKRTPWVGTRHRMDALYGRDFNVENMPDKVLDAIDDLFGPLNIDTVSQAIHFAEARAITDSKGVNCYVTPQQLRKTFGTIPVFVVYGAENGLADPDSARHFTQTLRDCDARFDDKKACDSKPYPDYGHQDCLVGYENRRTFMDVLAFFDANRPQPKTMPQPMPVFTFTAVVPSQGVRPAAGPHEYTMGDSSGRGMPFVVFCIPVRKVDGRYLPVDGNGQPVGDPTKWAGLIKVAGLDPMRTGSTERFYFELDASATTPPAGADGVLVLTVYNQSSEIGVPPNPAIHGATPTLSNLADLLPASTHAALAPNWAALHWPGVPPTLWGDIIRKMLQPIIDGLLKAATQAFARIGPAEMEASMLTAPVPDMYDVPGPRTFAVASCQYPGGLLDRTAPGVPGHAPAGPADASYQWLAELLESSTADPTRPKPEQLLLLGDQIYADASAGLFDPRVQDDRLRLSYDGFFGARGPRRVLARLPATMRFDDHEIIDNWEPVPNGRDGRPDGQSYEKLLQEGLTEYQEQQRCIVVQAPPPIEQQRTWTDVVLVGRSAFLADARSKRTLRSVELVAKASILGTCQFDDLERWLPTTPAGISFVTSASMVLPRRRIVAESKSVASALRSDAWDGYPASLRKLLGLVHRHGATPADDGGRRCLVFLSGDEHISNHTRITLTRLSDESQVVAHSIHASALYAPYPFANSEVADFANDEWFEFESDAYGSRETFTCCVQATHVEPPGDGYALVTVPADPAATTLTVRFDGPTRIGLQPVLLDFDPPPRARPVAGVVDAAA